MLNNIKSYTRNVRFSLICLEVSLIIAYLCTRFQQDLGEMLEWLKRHAWKACKPLKGFAGSNPALSAVENTMN